MSRAREDDDAGELAGLRRGRSEGLALAAMAVGITAFINLLGAEKGILAIALGVMALRGQRAFPGRRRARFAVVLGAIQLATVGVVLVLFREELGELLALLQTLG